MNERHDTVFTLIHTLQRHMGIELRHEMHGWEGIGVGCCSASLSGRFYAP